MIKVLKPGLATSVQDLGREGYYHLGIPPMPIYDPNQTISYLRDFMCLFKPGDIVKWKPIDRDE